MADKLTAEQALERAAGMLENIEAAVAPEAKAGIDVLAQVAQAYSTYALAYQLWNSHVDVRTGGGI